MRNENPQRWLPVDIVVESVLTDCGRLWVRYVAELKLSTLLGFVLWAKFSNYVHHHKFSIKFANFTISCPFIRLLMRRVCVLLSKFGKVIES